MTNFITCRRRKWLPKPRNSFGRSLLRRSSNRSWSRSKGFSLWISTINGSNTILVVVWLVVNGMSTINGSNTILILIIILLIIILLLIIITLFNNNINIINILILILLILLILVELLLIL